MLQAMNEIKWVKIGKNYKTSKFIFKNIKIEY